MAVEWQAPGPGDLDAWVAALSAIETVDRTGEVLGPDELEAQAGLSYFDPERDARLGWLDGRVVAWGTVVCIPNPRQRRVDLAGAVVPEHRGCGLGTALVRWQVARGREVVAERAGATPAWLELSASVADGPRTELFRAFGFVPLRYYHEMRRPLADAWPDVAATPDLGPDLVLVPFDPARDEQTASRTTRRSSTTSPRRSWIRRPGGAGSPVTVTSAPTRPSSCSPAARSRATR